MLPSAKRQFLMTTLLCSLLFTASVRSTAQNNALVFNGTSTYVELGNNALFNTNTSIRAMECWARFSEIPATGFREIISKSTNSAGMEILISGSGLSVFLMRGPGDNHIINYPASNITIDTWYHIVATWDGTDRNTARLYVNGVAVGTPTINGDISPGLANVGTLKIGQWSEPADPRYFPGQIDEVRIWNANRTAAQVKESMLKSLPATTPNLIAYYKFDETSGTAAINSSANSGLNGTIVDGSRIASPVQFGYNALHFDGVDDYVRMDNNLAYDLTTGTVEFMANPTVLTAEKSFIVGLRNTAGTTRFSLHMSNTDISVWNGTTLATKPFLFTPGQWYHIAFVFKATTTTLYIDGIQQGADMPVTFSGGTILPLYIGMVAGSPNERFNGAVDEVRIWNTQRTQSELTANSSFSLQGNEPGLVGLISFDQGITTGNNNGLTQITDKSATANKGVLFNMALNGVTSNYVSSSVNITLPVRLARFNVTRVNEKGLIAWQTSQEANSSHFEIERSNNGAAFNSIGKLKAAGMSNGLKNYSFTDDNPAKAKNFYRLKMVDMDGSAVLSETKAIDFTSRAVKLGWSSTDGHTIDINWSGSQSVNYFISDVSGRIINKGIIKSNTTRLNTLRPGTYILSVDDRTTPSVRFIVR